MRTMTTRHWFPTTATSSNNPRTDPGGKEAAQLKWLLGFAGWEAPLPDTLNDELLTALQKALFASKSRLAVLMSRRSVGLPLRFNLPGSYGIETWCNQLALSFPIY